MPSADRQELPGVVVYYMRGSPGVGYNTFVVVDAAVFHDRIPLVLPSEGYWMVPNTFPDDPGYIPQASYAM